MPMMALPLRVNYAFVVRRFSPTPPPSTRERSNTQFSSTTHNMNNVIDHPSYSSEEHRETIQTLTQETHDFILDTVY